jgi:pimeloyl-ACP methyl ester carboxylesterase
VALTLSAIMDELRYLGEHQFSFHGLAVKETALLPFSELNTATLTRLTHWGHRLLPFIPPLPGRPAGLTRHGSTHADTIFVNGILSNQELAMYQRDCLAMFWGRPIELLFNNSSGFLSDVLHCAFDRTNTQGTQKALDCAAIIKEKLQQHPRVTIVGYSQGGIIVAKALALLRHQLLPSDLSRIHFVSIAGGFREFTTPYVYAEHFGHSDDPVCKIGVFSAGVCLGKQYRRQASGHLLVGDYMWPLSRGDFGHGSRFYKQAKGKKRFVRHIKAQLSPPLAPNK